MRNGRDSSEDGSHRGFAQPAGLRRCWIVAALLSPAPRRADFNLGSENHREGRWAVSGGMCYSSQCF